MREKGQTNEQTSESMYTI